MTTVTHADREAAAAMQRWRAHDKKTGAEDAIREGLMDHLYDVKAFARHREEAIRALDPAAIIRAKAD